MELLLAVGFAGNAVAGTAAACTFGTSTLDHKTWQYAVEIQTIVKAFVGKINEVLNGLRRLFFVKLRLQQTFRSMYFSNFHRRQN